MNFPWFVFLRFFIIQIIAIHLILWLSLTFMPQFEVDLTGAYGRFFLVFFSFTVIFSSISSYHFTRPLRRALRRAHRISTKNSLRDGGKLFMENQREENDELLREEHGEYSELEYALNRIEKKLKKRKDQLLREREETATLMSSVQEGLVSIDINSQLLYFNSQFAALFLSPEQLKGEIPTSLTDVIRNPEVYEIYRKVLDSGIGSRVDARLRNRLDHQPRDFSISMNPLRDQKTGEIRGVIGVFYDITDIKKSEKIRIEFVSNASHELRTPLTSIKGYLETLKEDFSLGRYEQVSNFLSIISRNVDRLIELVNDLLNLSALEHNPELKLSRVNGLAISDHIVKELEVLAAEKKLMIRVTGEAQAFYADAQKVEQVLRNLVSNAIKYIGNEGQIHIRWEKFSEGGVVLRVIDNGPGIPEEHHQRLFERFYRIDKGRSRDAGGTGLGLAIVKHIMQSHGGTISVKSKLGVGSEFICVFPDFQRQHGSMISL